jgi:exodeoxyribonuclease III
MQIATWNVNSIRTRLDHVINWLLSNPVEVLCLQETKVVDPDFPRSRFVEMGYHVYISGQKSYNGVAIICRQPLENVTTGFTPILGAERVESFDDQKRIISGIFDDICVISVYVPNGGDLDSDKYNYKLKWLNLLQDYLQITIDKYPKLCICGDFNIAPDDRDIFDPKKLEGAVGLTKPEREALKEILGLGLKDAFRKFTTEGGHYSWWDYRAGAFPKNRGWRIDHHYLSTPLYTEAKSCIIDLEPRQLEKPSDHTPVVVEI